MFVRLVQTTHQVVERLIDATADDADEVAPVSVSDDALAELRQLELVSFRQKLGSGGAVVVADRVQDVGTLVERKYYFFAESVPIKLAKHIL